MNWLAFRDFCFVVGRGGYGLFFLAAAARSGKMGLILPGLSVGVCLKRGLETQIDCKHRDDGLRYWGEAYRGRN